MGDGKDYPIDDRDLISRKLSVPNAERIFWLGAAMRAGFGVEEIFELTKIDRWFLRHLEEIVTAQKGLALMDLRQAKKMGFSDRQIAFARARYHDKPCGELDIRAERKAAGIVPTYRLVDTCAAEFEAYTPYYYSTYGTENEAADSGRKKVMILGGGPNRIGQGIEFDYCCVHAAFALEELGIESIMVNSQPGDGFDRL